MLVFEALTNFSIHRLKKTWEKLSSRTMKQWDKIHQLCSWGGKPLKKLHAEVRLPAVPYLGTILNELTKVGQLPTWYFPFARFFFGPSPPPFLPFLPPYPLFLA